MPRDSLLLSRNTVLSVPDDPSSPLRHGLRMFVRDYATVFGVEPGFGGEEGAGLRVVRAEGTDERPESFRLTFAERDGAMVATLTGADDLGLIYGLLFLSERWLGVDPFWFWSDRPPAPCREIVVPAVDFVSPSPRVRHRGWMVNDEVCLIGWSDSYPPPESTWLPVFETLLRLGGNMVIPGTDLPRQGVHAKVAADMGLYVVHHHSEPLGAEMFFRVHPNSDASYDRNADLFEDLWREAIERQRDRKIIWTVGFRGQGDCPFWEQDPSYDTPERRGELIGRAVRRQYEMVREVDPDAPIVTYLYGELTELYRDGHLRLPPGVIKIWSDNGYGRMVTRRQWNHNPRVPSLPAPDEEGPHGVYYHVTFHDLQASAHLTMSPVSPDLIEEELRNCLDAGADELLLINCGNVRQHVMPLRMIAEMWRTGGVDARAWPEVFARTYFASAPERAVECLRSYFAAAIQYGPHEDDKAGEEFYHHPARSIVGHVMRGECDVVANDLIWAVDGPSFDAQVEWFRERCEPAAARYAQLKRECEVAAAELSAVEAVFFRDFLLHQTRLHHSGALGLSLVCRSVRAFREKRYAEAFVLASQAIWAYRESPATMADAEHDKWRGFYSADWLTNSKITIYAVDTFRRYIRTFGDNPDYFLWHKEYLMPESEKKIYLENTHRAPPSDDDLAERLAVKFGL